MKKMMKRIGAVSAFALAAMVAVADSVETSVVSVKGSAEYAAPGSSDFQKLNKGDRLRVGSKIRTGNDGAVLVSPFAGSAAQVGANSVVTLTEVDVTRKGDKISSRKAILDVSQGSVIGNLQKSRNTDFRIRAPKAIAAAKGTGYSVTQGANGAWTIVVGDGAVTVTLPNGSTKTVRKGEKIVIFADGSASDIEPALTNELAAVNAAREVAIALNLLTGEQTEITDVAAGVPIGADLIIINPANISGVVSPE